MLVLPSDTSQHDYDCCAVRRLCLTVYSHSVVRRRAGTSDATSLKKPLRSIGQT